MKKSPLLWILRRVRRRIPAIAVMTLAQVGQAVFLVLFALGSRGVIDSAVAGDPEAFKNACIYQGGIIVGILVCLTVLRHLRDRLQADLERDWKRNLLHGLLHGDYAEVSAYHSGELLNRLNNDVSRVNDGILTIAPSAASMVTRLVAAVSVLGVLDGRFTLLIVLAGVVVITATAIMRRKLKELNKRVSEHDGKVSGFLQETMEKLLMVQTMDVSREVERRSDGLLDERYEIQRKRKNISLITNTGISTMFQGAGFLALVWCSGRMLVGQMSFGSLTAIIQLVNQLQAPFVNLSGVMPKYLSMIASAERLMELEEITGASGIGKSTLLKLLLGVFRPNSGRLYISGEDYDLTLDRSTRRLFSYVPQGNLLLSGTLRENLTIVKPQATEEEIAQALYVSAMEDYLPQLPKGLDTVLGESGAGLSEGQAQRLAIARAVLGGAPVLLLDECTSALDADTEQKVLQRLKALPDRTFISGTHRPAATKLCDWRLEVENGKIRSVKVEQG